jgi:hypothetical protein
MATCQHCGRNPGPEAASEALEKAVGELRYYRLHRVFRLNEHPRTYHGANRIELVRLDADRRSIRQVRRLALRQIARYWRECSDLRHRYRSRLQNWMNEVQTELERRERVRRRRQLAGSLAQRGR